jgi:methionyl-tRNA synthetase
MDRFGLLRSGTKVTEKPEILFARQDIKEVMEKVEKIRDAQKQPEAPKLEHLPEISIDAFMSNEIRVVKVLNCEKVPKADKLLKFTLFDGERERTVVSGIAQYYKPEELIGKKLACVVNLAPHAFRGIVSEGMLLCSDADGSVKVLTIDDSVPEGSRIR